MAHPLKSFPAWIPVSLISLAVQTPLLLLPGPGRDEAAYYYWAHAAQKGYAPLLLFLVRALEWTGIPALTAMRIPSVAGGVLSLYLFDRFLRGGGVETRWRAIGLLALAFAPWHILVSSVLHPDALFLAALLALALALRGSRLVWAGVWGGAAVLVKPTGAVLLPVLALWILGRGISLRNLAALGVLVLVGLPGVLGLTPSMVREILEFAHLDPSLSPAQRLGLAAGSVLVQGGFLVPLAAVQGLAETVRRIRNGLRDDLPVLLVALTLVLLFGAAAVFNHQIKGTWFLPALVLLWPRGRLWIPRPIVLGLLVVSMLLGGILVGAMRLPALSARIEERLGLEPLYSRIAGSREGRVSSTRTLSQRFLEFQDLGPASDETLRRWKEGTGQNQPPRLIVSDDYGLAAQLAYQWRADRPELWIPGDGLFDRGNPRGHGEGALIVAVRRSPDEIWPEKTGIREIGVLAHPVTGETVTLGVPE